MNALTVDAVRNIVAAYYRMPPPLPAPIKPMQTFPVYANTIVLTWDALAVCRL